ncbi:MAG TPA: hypothetical protein VJZ32_08625 [Candidatus Bathyarchaeia archaeon]|nr:hypothetical protein [Candidatus Bathyarchaeia archaeon]
MLKPKRVQFGLLGLGQVGRNIIRQYGSLGFHWVSDSTSIWRRTDGYSLREIDLTHIMKSKKSMLPKHTVSNLTYNEFDNLTKQTDLLQSNIDQRRDRWVIIDSTYTDAKTAFEICSTTMGCLAYCCANKTQWANYEFCRQLYERARREQTFLCLNCTQGVWLDQMEYLPVLLENFESGKLNLVKRDNPSLNLFYEKIWKKVSPSNAFSQIRKQGYLEPNASDLFAEVKDQMIKAKVTQNFCSALTKIKADETEQIQVDDLFSKMPRSAKSEDIAIWHIFNRKQGLYPALTTEVQVKTDPAEIKTNLAFVNLPQDHPLARDFGGKNALCIEADEARFTWTNNSRRNKKKRGIFIHSGFGGALKTADKLVWEAKRVCRLNSSKKRKEFTPIPVLFGLKVGESYAIQVKHALSDRL